jgi:hypothetical protein
MELTRSDVRTQSCQRPRRIPITNEQATRGLRDAIALRGRRALTAKHNGSVGSAALGRNARDSNDSSGATITSVPAGAARAATLPRGGSAQGSVFIHERSPVSMTSSRCEVRIVLICPITIPIRRDSSTISLHVKVFTFTFPLTPGPSVLSLRTRYSELVLTWRAERRHAKV